jgi:hypothetical protein
MIYPLVRELAAEKIPVAVTCRVLGFSTQAYYKWLAQPVSQRDWDDADLINAAYDIHADNPAFGYRLIAVELREVRSESWRTQPRRGPDAAVLSGRGGCISAAHTVCQSWRGRSMTILDAAQATDADVQDRSRLPLGHSRGPSQRTPDRWSGGRDRPDRPPLQRWLIGRQQASEFGYQVPGHRALSTLPVRPR